jgi:hypothetical protein
LAVLEVPAKGAPILVPVCIDVDGQFYDAGLYLSTPRPLALDPGTVYEAERSGDSVGLFTVSGAAEIDGAWVGQGEWRPHNAGAENKSQFAKAAPKQPVSDDEGPPVLKRPGSESQPPPASSPSKEQPKPEAKAQAPSSSEESEQDSGRPVLRRGKPGEEQIRQSPETATRASASNHGGIASTGVPPVLPAGLVTAYPAISDAHARELRSYAYELRPAERHEYEQKLSEMASQELASYLRRLPGPRPAKTPLQQDGPLYAFDPNWSNQPTFVLSAMQPSERPGVEYYITVVVHNDLYGQLRRQFVSITNTLRLSVTPRLQMIDMVDADGNQRGDLLFRQMWDDRTSYVIYSVGMDKLDRLFQGAEMKKTVPSSHP